MNNIYLLFFPIFLYLLILNIKIKYIKMKKHKETQIYEQIKLHFIKPSKNIYFYKKNILLILLL